MSADAQTPPAETPPSKGKTQLPFIIALVVGLAAGVGAGLFVVGPAMANGITPAVAAAAKQHPKKKATAEEDDASSDEASADDDDEDDGDDESAKKDEKGGEGEKASEVYTLDNLVLNPAESGGSRFLLLSITFQSKDAKVLEAMKARDAELRDVVLVTLGAKTVDQLANMTVRDSLKVDLANATKKLLKKKKAKIKVYFPQFVIQ